MLGDDLKVLAEALPGGIYIPESTTSWPLTKWRPLLGVEARIWVDGVGHYGFSVYRGKVSFPPLSESVACDCLLQAMTLVEVEIEKLAKSEENSA